MVCAARLDRSRLAVTPTLAQAPRLQVDLRSLAFAAFAPPSLEQPLCWASARSARRARPPWSSARGLDRLRFQLEERSPLRVLERGYAIATDAAGNILKSVEGVNLGDAVTVQLRHGQLTTEVKEKKGCTALSGRFPCDGLTGRTITVFAASFIS